MKLKIKKLHKDAILPRYANPHDSGLDLYSCEDNEIVLRPGEHYVVKTGIATEPPEGTETQIRPRSGLAKNFGITVLNSPGTIDNGYRGEIGVNIINLGQETFVINKGDKIAQMVIAPFISVDVEEVEDLSNTERGANSFGSSGR